MGPNIFISYRRVDSEGYAGRIYDRLQTCFGVNRVFMDITNISVGENFADAINQAIGSCGVVIVVIGPRWCSVLDEMGRKRLDDPNDFVRVEVQAALDRDVLIVPVLVKGVKMPKSLDLPIDLRDLSLYQAIELRHRHFDADFFDLVVMLEQHFGESARQDARGSIVGSSKRFRHWRLLIFAPLIVAIVFLGFWVVSRLAKTALSTTVSVESALETTSIPADNVFSVTVTNKLAAQAPTEIPFATATPFVINSPTLTLPPIPTPTTRDSLLQKEILDGFNIRMVFVPQGPFKMGSDGVETWDIISSPSRSVSLDMFYIDKYEVSNAQYATCVSAGVCKEPTIKRSRTRHSYYDNPQYTDYPVIYVSWHDAQMFCSWRGGRLPREAEWEKAARGTEEDNYPWGNGPVDCRHANYRPIEACEGDTAPVSHLNAGVSPYGAYNMSGNVYEWVDDWFQPYPGGDPKATKAFGATRRVIRGGAYFEGANRIKVTAREGMNPDDAVSFVGFRCVIDIKALP
jgi:formylglycine-generating enzyme required for sulfatase activity